MPKDSQLDMFGRGPAARPGHREIRPTSLSRLGAPHVDPTSALYRRGFCAGFVAPLDAEPPSGLDDAELAGWLDGRDGVQVPAWRF
jgi:hypothetical protein